MFKYTREFKCSVAKECLNGVSSRSLARQYSISSSQISYWAQVFAIHAERSFSPTAIENTALIKLEALNLMWTNNWSINHTSAILNLSSPPLGHFMLGSKDMKSKVSKGLRLIR